MNYSAFAGFITGILFALLVLLVLFLVLKRRGRAAVDERLGLILSRSFSWAFIALAVFAFLGWIADNLQAYRQSGEPRFLSPWSTVLLAAVVFFLLAFAYHYRTMSIDGDATPQERMQMRLSGILMGAGGLLLAPSANYSFSHNLPLLGYVGIASSGLLVLAAISMLVKAQRSA